jgi:hypothetical protein
MTLPLEMLRSKWKQGNGVPTRVWKVCFGSNEVCPDSNIGYTMPGIAKHSAVALVSGCLLFVSLTDAGAAARYA